MIVDRQASLSNAWIAFLILVVGYFIAKAIFFALSIGPDIIPDETTHFGKSLVFQKYLWLPADSAETYHLGLIAHTPNLYFFLMGKLLSLNVTPLPDLSYLRLINVMLGLATVLLSYRWIRLFALGPLAEVLFLVLITNTLMFTFLSAGVSPDNLVNLLAVASLLALFSWLDSREVRQLVLLLLWISLGALTKPAFLPFAAAVVCVLLVREYGSYRSVVAGIAQYFSPPSIGRLALGGFVVMGLVFVTALYGTNLVKYQRLVPHNDQVLELPLAMQYRIFARNHIVSEFRRAQISYEEAAQMAKSIPHAGDRAGTLSLLGAAIADKQQRNPRMDRLQYAGVWTQMMLGRIYGIMGHTSMVKRGSQLYPYYAVFLLAAVLASVFFRSCSMNGHGLAVTFIFLSYALVLMQLVNYGIYESSGHISLALQGRYIFPVLGPMSAILTCMLMSPASPRFQWVVLIVVGAVFVYGEFPFFLQHATERWFM